jgi:hypothetical protein
MINWDTVLGVFLGAGVGAIIYLWQRFVGKSDKASESLLSLQLEHLEKKIDECLLEVRTKQLISTCDLAHARCEQTLIRGLAELALKRNISDCDAKEKARDVNLENRKRAINGHIHDANGKAIFGGME